MKLIKTLVAIILIELIIAIPVVVGIYTWGMVGFQPSNANECAVTGQFYDCTVAEDQNGNVNTYYQFKANDDSVWWQLTAQEIGFIPNSSAEYTLTYDNNGTTKANKPCDCTDECECEIYDDIFLGVKAK